MYRSQISESRIDRFVQVAVAQVVLGALACCCGLVRLYFDSRGDRLLFELLNAASRVFARLASGRGGRIGFGKYLLNNFSSGLDSATVARSFDAR